MLSGKVTFLGQLVKKTKLVPTNAHRSFGYAINNYGSIGYRQI